MPVQSLVFNRRYWSPDAALRWAKKHGFHADFGLDKESASTIRIRQRPPPTSPLTRYYTTSVWSSETNKPVQLVVYEFDSPDKFVYNLPFSTETGKRIAPKYLKGRAPPPPVPGYTPPAVATKGTTGIASLSGKGGAHPVSSLLDYYSGLLPTLAPATASQPGATSVAKFMRRRPT